MCSYFLYSEKLQFSISIKIMFIQIFFALFVSKNLAEHVGRYEVTENPDESIATLPSLINTRQLRYEVTEEPEIPLNTTKDIRWMLMPDGKGSVEPAIIYGLHRNDEFIPGIERVQFVLYTRDNAKKAEVRNMTNSCLPVFKYFKPDRKTKILIHGFGDNVSNSYMVPLLRDALLAKGDYNVIAVDWSDLSAKPWYWTATHNVQPVSKHLARFIDHMTESTGAKTDDFHLIGFSLGAHVAGLTGSNVRSGKIKHITGLDPAYILFASTGPDGRLDASQARLVDVVHTSGGYIGYEKPLGHRDFYPNGGWWPQPGCRIDFAAVCSHRRAYYYYGEALKNTKGFTSTRCDSYANFTYDKCSTSKHDTVELGKFTFNEKYRGLYFLDTNPNPPYGKSQDNSDPFDELENWKTK